MKNKKTIKQNSYIKHYTTQLLLILASFFILLGVANAGTFSQDLSDNPLWNDVQICMADGSIFQEKINNVYYVNDWADIQTTLNLANSELTTTFQKNKVYVSAGIYNATSTINMPENVILEFDEGALIQIYNNFNIIEMNASTSVIGGVFKIPSGVAYNSNVINIEANHYSATKKLVIENIYITSQNQSGTAININAVDSGDSLSFARFENIFINEFENGIKINSNASDGSAYINGNWFINIQSSGGTKTFFLWKNTGSNQIDTNIIRDYEFQTESSTISVFNFTGVTNTIVSGQTFDYYTKTGRNTSIILDSNSNNNDFMTTGNGYRNNIINEGQNNHLQGTGGSNYGVTNYGYNYIKIDAEQEKFVLGSSSTTGIDIFGVKKAGANITFINPDSTNADSPTLWFTGTRTDSQPATGFGIYAKGGYSYGRHDLVIKQHDANDYNTMYDAFTLSYNGDITTTGDMDVSGNLNTANFATDGSYSNEGISFLSNKYFSSTNPLSPLTTSNNMANVFSSNSKSIQYYFVPNADEGDSASSVLFRFYGTNNTGSDWQRGEFGYNAVTDIFEVDEAGLQADDYYSGDGTQGMTGSCASGTTLTVKDGLITACS